MLFKLHLLLHLLIRHHFNLLQRSLPSGQESLAGISILSPPPPGAAGAPGAPAGGPASGGFRPEQMSSSLDGADITIDH